MKGKIKITVSPYSGFCFGVERAIKIAKIALSGKKRVFSLGPIIRNPEAVADLSKKGLAVRKSLKGLDRNKDAILVPSHGADPGLLKRLDLESFDTTCPLVRRVQNIVRDLAGKGYFIVIVGKKDHPEVRSLTAIAGRNSVVVKDQKGARRVKTRGGKIAVISQTTSRESDFRDVLKEISKKNFSELAAFNTVCDDSIKRQRTAREIAKKVDAMLIIGGKASSNTSRLACASRALNKRTHHIESAGDLRKGMIRKAKKVGIAAGASTPPGAVKKTIEKIRRIEREW